MQLIDAGRTHALLDYPGLVEALRELYRRGGRVVVGGLSAEAALKEAHARVEEIHKIRSRS